MPKSSMLLVLPVLAALAGCAAPAANLAWERADVTPQVAAQDSFECKQTARVTTPGGGFIMGRPGVVLIGSMIMQANKENEQREVFNECMAARGYNAQPAAQ
jgi:hypothetical protein